MKVDLKQRERFIQAIGAAAREAMLKTGIPASFLIGEMAFNSHFGSKKMFSQFAVPIDRFIEPMFNDYNNRWSYVLHRAQSIKSYYNLSGDQDARSLIRTLTNNGYFARQTLQPKRLTALIQSYRLEKWDTFAASEVRAYKREWLRSHLLAKFVSAVKEARRAGVPRSTLAVYLQVS